MTKTKAYQFYELGSPDVLKWEDVELAPLGPDQVLYKVEAIGLNRGELVILKGKHAFQPPFPSGIGFESVGIVQEVGSAVDDLIPGDRIMTMVQAPPFGGVAAELAVASAYSVCKCPGDLPAELACAIWAQYLTAYFGLVTEANIRMSDNVLITAASGHAGMGAIEFAKIAGATVIATTRSADKVGLLREYGADHVVVTNGQGLSEEVMKLTAGRGVNIVYDAISGSFIQNYADCLSLHATVLLYGLLNEDPAAIPLQPFARAMAKVRVYSVLSHTGPDNIPALHTARDYILNLVTSGKLNPRIDKVFSMDKLADAYKHMDRDGHIGKVIVKAQT